MALAKKDLLLIKDLITDQLVHERQYLRVALDQQSQDIKRDIRDEMEARFSAFHSEMKGDGENLKKEIRGEFMEVIHDYIIPAIDRVDLLPNSIIC